MPKILVEVMPKAVILDPQGKAVLNVLQRLGHEEFEDVRVGKRFELSVNGPVSDELLSKVQQIAEQVFANGNIEDVVSVSALPEN